MYNWDWYISKSDLNEDGMCVCIEEGKSILLQEIKQQYHC